MSKQRLINQAKPDNNIAGLQSTNPKLYKALKNFGDVIQSIINGTFPVTPAFPFEWRAYLSGNPAVGNDVLDAYFRVVLPKDPTGNWIYTSVLLDRAFITAKTEGTSVTTSLDVKVSQQKGTSAWKSLFQSGFSPHLPANKRMAHHVKYAINNLYQDDLLRLDVLTSDSSIAGIELVLTGTYVTQEVTTN